jgi:hypothetical protein
MINKKQQNSKKESNKSFSSSAFIIKTEHVEDKRYFVHKKADSNSFRKHILKRLLQTNGIHSAKAFKEVVEMHGLQRDVENKLLIIPNEVEQ